MKTKSLIWIAIAIGLLVFVFAKIGSPDKEALKESKAQAENLADQTIPVTLITPQVRDLQPVLEVSGAVKSGVEVQVGAKATGRLTSVFVKDGSPVRKGQILAQVETNEHYERLQQAMAAVEVAESARQQSALQAQISPQQSQAAIRQAEAALSSAKARLRLLREGARSQERNQARERVNESKARLDKAKADFERAKRLYEGDAISRADLEAAQLNYDSALAAYRTAVEQLDAITEGARPAELQQAEDDVRQAEEQLRIAKTNASNDVLRRQQLQQAEANLRQARANVRLAQMQIADAAIVSPVDGYVSGTPAQVGQVVNPGSPIALVVSERDLYLSAQIPEKEVSSVRIGMIANVTMDAIPNRTFVGRVVAIDPRADSLGRLFGARITISDGTGVLKSGMFGRAKISLDPLREVTTVPDSALLQDGNQYYLFTAEGDKAKKVEVSVRRSVGGYSAVSGIALSDKVILKGKNLVSDGSAIREDKPTKENA